MSRTASFRRLLRFACCLCQRKRADVFDERVDLVVIQCADVKRHRFPAELDGFEHQLIGDVRLPLRVREIGLAVHTPAPVFTVTILTFVHEDFLGVNRGAFILLIIGTNRAERRDQCKAQHSDEPLNVACAHADYWPLKFALRFSRNAVTPSRKSSERKHAA